MQHSLTQDREKEIEFWDKVSKKEESWIKTAPTTEMLGEIMTGTHGWTHHWWEPLVGKIEGKKVLDIGCGNTYFVAYWQLTGNEATGSDFSPETVKTNKLLHERLGLKGDFYVASSEKIEAGDNSLDVVHMRWVVHHIPPELQNNSIQEINRVLKPGGQLMILETNFGYPFRWIVQTPTLRNINVFRKYAIKKGILDPEEKALTNRGYINLLEKNGFTIKAIDYSFNFFEYPVCIMTENKSVRNFAKKFDMAIKKVIPNALRKDIKIIAEKS